MKKNIIVYCLIFSCFCVNLYANKIEATGYGNTYEDALASAREELAKSLQISINYNSISTNIDNGKINYSSFNETSIQKTNIELLGSFVIKEYNNIIGDFSNKVIIGMDSNISLPIYLEKLSDLKSQIEDDKYQNMEDSLKIQLLNYKIDCYELFNSYKYIALELGANVDQIPLINITKLGLQIQLFELSTNMNVISDKSLNKSNIIKDTSNIRKNIYNTFSDIEKDKINIIINNFRDTNLQDKYYINSNDIEKDINILLQIKTEWDLIWEPYNKIIEEEKAIQDDIYLGKKEAIEKEPYRVAETVNGQISEVAKKARLDLIHKIEDEKNDNIDEFVAELISENFDSDFALVFEKTKKQINYIDKLDYSLSLRNKNKLSLFIDDYDGIREAWPCILIMKINNNELKYEFYLPYSQLVKIDAPNPKKCTNEEWYEYLDNVDIYDYLLNNYLDKFLDLQINFNITVIDSKINLKSLDIMRLDNNQIAYSKNIYDSYNIDLDIDNLKLLLSAKDPYNKYLENINLEWKQNNPKLFSRSGLSLGVGYGVTNIDLFNLSRPDLGQTSFISNNIELIASSKHLYCGLSLSSLFTLNVLNNGNSISDNGVLSINKLYSDLYGVFGFYFPTISNKKVISPFFDLRLSPKPDNYPKFIGGVGMGIEVRQYFENKKLIKYSILFSWLPIQKDSPYGRSYLSILLGI